MGLTVKTSGEPSATLSEEVPVPAFQRKPNVDVDIVPKARMRVSDCNVAEIERFAVE